MRVTPEEEADHSLAIVWLAMKAGLELTADGDGMIHWRYGKGDEGKWPTEEIQTLLKSYKRSVIHYLRAIRHVEPGQALREELDSIAEEF